MSFYRKHRWADTVTVFHRETSKDGSGRTVTNWSSVIADGCFYGLSKRQTLNDTVLAEHDRHICRIPGDQIDALEKGDVICRGIVEIDIPQNSSPEKHLAGIEHFTADVVSDNRQLPNTAHWYAGESSWQA